MCFRGDSNPPHGWQWKLITMHSKVMDHVYLEEKKKKFIFILLVSCLALLPAWVYNNLPYPSPWATRPPSALTERPCPHCLVTQVSWPTYHSALRTLWDGSSCLLADFFFLENIKCFNTENPLRKKSLYYIELTKIYHTARSSQSLKRLPSPTLYTSRWTTRTEWPFWSYEASLYTCTLSYTSIHPSTTQNRNSHDGVEAGEIISLISS